MRIFIAVELPVAVRDSVEALKPDLKQVKALRFVSKENMHLTLKFLGDLDERRVGSIKSSLAKVKLKPFKMGLGRLGLFPDERNPRVLWVGAEPAEPLMALKREVDGWLPSFKDDHPFQTHITIARIGILTHDEKKRLLELVADRPVPKKEFIVDRITLFKSTLTPEGPVYEKLAEFS
jgi:2'-5' RNA ligase